MRNIEEAVEVLVQHIAEIATVAEWAEKMGFTSTDYFSRKFRNHFGIRPKEILVEKRLEKIGACLLESPNDIYYCIARKLQFADYNAMHKFVNRHTGKCISSLKKGV